MRTRQAADALASRFVNVDAIPASLRHDIVDFLSRLEDDAYESRSAMLRSFLGLPVFAEMAKLPHEQIAQICRCGPTLVHNAFAAVRAGQEVRRQGRPSVLNDESMEILTNWVRDRTERMDWITVHEFKGKVVDLLERQGVQNYPVTQFYRDLLDRLDGGRFCRVMAAPLEQERFMLSQETISRHFSGLGEAGIQEMRPELIINLDETGFGVSRSHRLKGIPVITSKSFTGKPCVPIAASRVYVSAIAAITASGDALAPGLIVRRTTLTEEFESVPIGSAVRIYRTEKAFVTKNVFDNYVMEVVFDYIGRWRHQNDCAEARAMILVDGHSAHLSDELKAACALRNIVLMLMPPHSSHLLQPLDRLYFSRVKQCYAVSTLGASLSETSRQILRVAAAFEASKVKYVICESWAMTGIVPVVEKREVTAVRLDPDSIAKATSLQHSFSGNERERGARNERATWGLLNEDQMMIYEAGQCPFCCAELPPDWEY